MLSYNPYFRPSVSECLANPIFDSIRCTEHEKKALNTMTMPIYDEGCYDYEECVSVTHKTNDFKVMIFEEMISVKS